MKNVIHLIYVASLLLMSCESKMNEADLIGNWKTVEFKANTPQLSPALIEGAEAESLSTSYSFHKDHTCSLRSNYNPNGLVGKYEFIADSSLIKMSYTAEGDTIVEAFEIELLNSNTLKWKQELGELGNLVMTLEKE